VSSPRSVNARFCTDKLRADYAHVGLYDVSARKVWIARKAFGIVPVRLSHARLINAGDNESSTADKDHFVCFWFHTPNTDKGYVHGYPIEWEEGHLLVRLDPNWNYLTRQFIPATNTAQVEKNIEQQYEWGRRIFDAYLACKPRFAMSWHMIGPRAADSMFYVHRVEKTK